MSNHLLFQAYTERQVAGCRHFLLKYLALYNLKPPADTKVIVYTNTPVAFEGFTTFFSHFEMPGAPALPGQAHKTTLLHHFFQLHNGPVLFCHTTTYPLQPLEPLFTAVAQGHLYLHAPQRHPESDLNNVFRKFRAIADKTATTGAAPAARFTVWRASIIGLNEQHKALLEKVMQEEAHTDNELASDYNYTRCFSEAGPINSAAPYLFDYSGFNEFGQLLETFFKKNEEESIPNQVKLLHHIDAAAIQQQKEQFQRLPLFKKWLQTITGKQWRIKQYENRW